MKTWNGWGMGECMKFFYSSNVLIISVRSSRLIFC